MMINIKIPYFTLPPQLQICHYLFFTKSSYQNDGRLLNNLPKFNNSLSVPILGLFSIKIITQEFFVLTKR